MTEFWITSTEAVRLTGYNAEYIRRLVRSGKVKVKKFGIVWQIDRDFLLTYMQSSKRRGPRDKT